MKKIKIPAKKKKKSDDHKRFTIQVPDKLYDKLTDLAAKTEYSRNEIVVILLSEAITNTEVIDSNKDEG